MNSTAPGSNSESSFVNCAAASRDCAGSTGGAALRLARERADAGEANAACNCASSGSSAAATCCLRGFHFGRGGPVANEFLQRAGGGLHGLGADVAGHAFERVREALGESRVALGQRGGDLPDRRALLLDELAEEFQIELAIARDAGQAVLACRGRRWQGGPATPHLARPLSSTWLDDRSFGPPPIGRARDGVTGL